MKLSFTTDHWKVFSVNTLFVCFFLCTSKIYCCVLLFCLFELLLCVMGLTGVSVLLIEELSLWLSSLSPQLSFFFGFLSAWVLMCFFRWSLRTKRLSHVGHENRFSPVCVRRCRWSSSDRRNRFPQNNQLHTNGRSPVCQRKCAFRCET